jgi:hypothetical protein
MTQSVMPALCRGIHSFRAGACPAMTALCPYAASTRRNPFHSAVAAPETSTGM